MSKFYPADGAAIEPANPMAKHMRPDNDRNGLDDLFDEAGWRPEGIRKNPRVAMPRRRGIDLGGFAPIVMNFCRSALRPNPRALQSKDYHAGADHG